MNTLLWVLQILLALWNLIGGSYEITHYATLEGDWAKGLPNSVWTAYGSLQILSALGLFWPKLARFSAIFLALLELSGCALFAKYAGFPGCLWGVVPAALLAFVAYGRFKLKPA